MLDAGASFLALDAALPRSSCWPGWASFDRCDGRLPDQVEEARQCILTIARLGTVALRDDDKHTFIGQPRAREPLQPIAHIVWEGRRVPYVEAKLHRGGKLVDVLPTRARGAHETLVDFALVDGNVGGDMNHDSILSCPAKAEHPGIPASDYT